MQTPNPHSTRRSAFTRSTIALIGILLLAFTIRIIGIDWDEGRYLHPDERHIVADVLVGRVEVSWPPRLSWLEPDRSPINPRPAREDGNGYEEFAYGAFPVYVVDTLGAIAEQLTDTDWNGYQRANYIGRGISILLDTGTVLLVFLIAASIAGRTAGLLGAAIYAFLPVAIQASHFFTVDSWMTFFIFATIYACIQALHSGGLRLFALAGALSGFALATKLSAAPVVGIVALAVVLTAVHDARVVTSGLLILRNIALRGMLALLAFLVVFVVGEPFAFLDPDAFLTSFRTQSDIQTGAFDVPFTQQYVGTARGAYQLVESTRYSMGPVAVLMGTAGAAIVGWLILRRSSPAAIILAAWVVASVVTILIPETKFPRYLLPIAPAMAILAGIAITAGLLFLNRRYGRVIGVAFVAVMMLLTSGYGAAFANVNTTEHSRLAASLWIYEHLEPGTTTTSEVWDDRLPLSLMPGLSSDALRIDDASINLYAYTPTYGDIAQLEEAVRPLPQGELIAAALASGNIPQATSLLRSVTTPEITGAIAASSLPQMAASLPASEQYGFFVERGLTATNFHGDLIEAAAAMTTSGDLARDVTSVATSIVDQGEINPDQLSEIARLVEMAADQSMVRQLYTLFQDADYYVIVSDRVQRGMEQNPWRYAVPNRMYELLDSGAVGFEQIAEFSSSPSLFGLTFPDADADESFLNYDHPTVRIYEKTELVPYNTFVQFFGSAALQQTDPSRNPDTEPLTFDEPVSGLPVVDDYRWSESITGSSWGAALVWVVMLVALQAAALPLAASAFRSFPDRGWGLTRIIGMIVPATVVWWLSSVGLLRFWSVWVVTAFLLFALASWLWLRRAVSIPRGRLSIIAAAEIVFWITFFVFLVYRMINPDSWHPFWGGEKPMEFAQINAILRSPEFPPVDPWYAQGYINYYYYGFYLMAFLIKLTGVPTEFAFNLAQPTVMAMLAAGTFSVGAALSHRLSRGRQGGIVGGIIAALLVSFAGNLLTVGRLIDDFQGEVGFVSRFDFWVWGPSRAIPFAITEFPYFTGLYGDLHSHVVGLPLLVLSIALASTFAFDHHAHDQLPRSSWIARIGLTAIALGVVYPANAWDLPVTAALIVGAIIIGSASARSAASRLRTIVKNTLPVGIGALLISLPFLLHFEALFGSVERTRTTTTLLELESHLGGLLLILTAAVSGLFMLHRSPRRRLDPTIAFLALGATLLLRWAAVDLWPSAIPWLDGLTVGIVAAIWISAVPGVFSAARRLDFGLPTVTAPAIAVGTALIVLAMIVVERPVTALYLGIALPATAWWLAKRSSPSRFAALMVAGATYIGAGTEFVFVVDDLAGIDWYRMNTIFKFYNQVWILLGIAGGAAAGVFVSNVLASFAVWRTETAQVPPPAVINPRSALLRSWTIVATVVSILVLVLSSAYPVIATGIRLDTRFEPREGGLTLEAYSWMDYGTIEMTNGTVLSFEEDRDVIDWFNSEVSGTPVIAEASFGPYRCNSSRISIGTGLPSVLGWQRHEEQQRYKQVLPQRDADLRALYGTDDVNAKLAIIDRYDIQYIVVGQLERNYPVLDGNDCTPMDETPAYQQYDLETGIATLERMEGSTLEQVFSSGDTVVYRVKTNS